MDPVDDGGVQWVWWLRHAANKRYGDCLMRIFRRYLLDGFELCEIEPPPYAAFTFRFPKYRNRLWWSDCLGAGKGYLNRD